MTLRVEVVTDAGEVVAGTLTTASSAVLNPDRLLDAAEVGEMLGHTTRWVLDKTREGHIPKVPLPNSRIPRYRRESILKWLDDLESTTNGRKRR
jgi:predicted DNA-binding transcriptional regulator AlpA